MKKNIIISMGLMFIIFAGVYAQSNFSTSLHATREGKNTAYKKENGGMELITGIPMDSITCMKCHPAKYPDGTPVDAKTYTPSCKDCHDFSQGSTVKQETCLGCHNRQTYEMQLYPDDSEKGDVHRKKGLTCISCHKKEEVHGDDGVSYKSWMDEGAVQTKCTDCHSLNSLPDNSAHSMHGKNTDKFECNVCHTESIVSCTNCHFETLLATGKNRPQTKIKGFQLLLKKNGKYTTGTYMTHIYNGKTNVIVAPFRSHVITGKGKSCDACHANMGNNNAAIAEYNNTGQIQMTKWDEATKKLTWAQGVVPVPADWNKAFKFDFTTYTGDIMNLTSDPQKWTFVKSEADNAHLFYAEALTNDEMKKLGFTREPTGVNEISQNEQFKLWNCYPNPANVSSTVKYNVILPSKLNISLYSIDGNKVATVIDSFVNIGEYAMSINTKDLPSGTYYLILTSGNKKLTQKLVVNH